MEIATDATTTEHEARELLAEARERAVALAHTSEFQAQVALVAAALLQHGELSGGDLDQLLEGT